MSRRTLLAAGAGATLGACWAAALRASTLPDCPTLAVVGEDASQLVLLDTTGIRALIVLGHPAGGLVEQVPGMMTLLRQRIDLVIGDELAIDALGATFMGRWAVKQQLRVPATTGGMRAPDQATRMTVARDMALSLGNGFSLDVRVSPRQEWRAGAAAVPVWSVTLRQAGNVIVVAPDTSSATQLGPIRPSLAIAPGPDPDLLIQRLGPGGIVVNARHLDDAEPTSGDVARIRAFPEDIARFELRAEGISLPAWAG